MSTVRLTTPTNPQKSRVSVARLLRNVLRSPTTWLPCVLSAKGLELNAAVLRGDVATAKRLLERGADPNYHFDVVTPTVFDFTPTTMLNAFLAAYPTPLLAALHNFGALRPSLVAEADVEMVTMLLEYGANVRLRRSDRTPVLHIVTELGRADLVNEMIKYGAPVNARDGSGNTALANAIARRPFGPLRNEEPGIANILMQHGASLISMCEWDTDCDHSALAARLVGWNSRALLLLWALTSSHIEPQSQQSGQPTRWLETATDIHLACLLADTHILEFLLDRGSLDLNAKDGMKLTPLEYSAIIGAKEKMKMLIARGADIHCVDENGLSLIHRAVLAQRVDIIRFLTENGEDVNTRIAVLDGYTFRLPEGDSSHRTMAHLTTYAVKSQLTPIQLAVVGNRRESVTTLIDCHARVDAFRYPAMPLYFGALRHGTALVKQLTNAGSTVRPEDITLSAIIAMSDMLRVNIQVKAPEPFLESCAKQLGLDKSDLLSLHDEEDETAYIILLGQGDYEEVYLGGVKSILEIIGGYVTEQTADKAIHDTQSPPKSRSSSMVGEFGSAGVLAVEPPAVEPEPIKYDEKGLEADSSPYRLSRASSPPSTSNK